VAVDGAGGSGCVAVGDHECLYVHTGDKHTCISMERWEFVLILKRNMLGSRGFGLNSAILQWASVTHGGANLHVATCTYVLYDVHPNYELPGLYLHCLNHGALRCGAKVDCAPTFLVSCHRCRAWRDTSRN
jgi:hypothetical protein